MILQAVEVRARVRWRRERFLIFPPPSTSRTWRCLRQARASARLSDWT
jgi:hypothetical protein